MKRIILTNKPLVEAIFELRWELIELESKDNHSSKIKFYPFIKTDPYYKLLVGRLYDKLMNEYPYHEQLPSANMPDEISGYIVQHRFRKDKDKWPLVQIGPGILTVNDTESYVWEDFIKRIELTIGTLFELYPNSNQNLKINKLMLRYIDSIKFNIDNENIFEFLKNKMKTEINLYSKLFEDTQVESTPFTFDIRFEFKSLNPEGKILLKFGRGRRKSDQTDLLMWETVVQIDDSSTPNDKIQIMEWLNKAHILTDDWFFKLIEGELQKRFK